MNKKTKRLALLLVAVCMAFSGFLGTSSKVRAAGAWGKQYKSLTPTYYNIFDALDVGGQTIYTSIQKKKGASNFVLSLPRKHVEEKNDGPPTFTLDYIANHPLYNYSPGGFIYQGINYDEASGPEEINGTFVYRGYSDANYSHRDLFLNNHKVTYADLSSRCNDAGDLDALQYKGQILGYNASYYVNCPNLQKTLIFSATGEYSGSTSGGGSALASQISCSGDMIVASEPARETNGTYADAYYEYGTLRAYNAKCSNGNLYFTNNADGLKIYKNGILLSSDIYSSYYTILNGKAYWRRNDGNISNEDGSITKKPKKYTIDKIFNYRNHIGMIARLGHKNVILYKK
jgi:hypothetical protein